ncbi:MAG: hypothetical protein K9H25_03920 [Rhodospirillum sp.]|nr:hypothetical protein [Rhodospirillum sp.]MCF8488820.1 hypothetical protein [Rhodospirillum sp.]MCF8500902.1 hypothetical protein [Rhodospirillum sp.]
MILTPIALTDLPSLLVAFDALLADAPLARRVFARIAETRSFVRGETIELSTDPDHHRQAVDLVRAFGLGVIDGPPSAGFTWDGKAVRADMEPSVLVHEIGHWQVCAPARRDVIDFGLGAGPETGLKAPADAVATVTGVLGDLEEALASLLGILWEAELDQPAILAFLEQNWLADGATEANRAHFVKIVDHLAAHGFLTNQGRPTRRARVERDAVFLESLLA